MTVMKSRTPLQIAKRAQTHIEKDKHVRIGRWTEEEHRFFLQGVEQYGRSWKKITSLMKTRTALQIRTHAQTYVQKEKQTAPKSSGHWTEEEHSLFLRGMEQHGRDWKKNRVFD